MSKDEEELTSPPLHGVNAQTQDNVIQFHS